MQPSSLCQSCHRAPEGSLLNYRKGASVVHREGLLQCDICERFACSECLEVYDFFSGYDFLCHECVQQFAPPPRGERGH